MRSELVIKNGILVDGSGSTAYRADIHIVDDCISGIGNFDNNSCEQIDASGMVVAPGFVDIHSHSDYTLLVDPRAESSIYQGVTTEIIGNCGHGCFPINDPQAASNSIYGFTGQKSLNWQTMLDYFNELEKARPAVNVATLIPNGQLRRVVLETRKSNTTQNLKQMKRMVEEGLQAGAWGFSTGLEYPIEKDSSIEELVEICKVVKKYDGLYATHTRDRDTNSVAAVVEGIETAKRSGVRLQVSHLLPRSGPDDGRRCVEVVENARNESVPVTFDQHTRSYGFTFLKVLLPNELLDNDLDMVREHLSNPLKRNRLKEYKSIINSGELEKWKRIKLLPDKRFPEIGGKYFSELAEIYNKEPMDIALDLLFETLEDYKNPLMVITDCYSETEQAEIFSHELCVPGSDATALCTNGPLSNSIFPGAYSWASWYYRFMVNDKKLFSKEHAIKKLSSEPAQIIGLKKRGELKPGYYADIVIFDPNDFTECITLERPNRLAKGVREVIVNGVSCLRNGKLTGERSGRILKAIG